MNSGTFDIILAAAALLAALAIAAIGALGVIVWLAGGRGSGRRDRAG